MLETVLPQETKLVSSLEIGRYIYNSSEGFDTMENLGVSLRLIVELV